MSDAQSEKTPGLSADEEQEVSHNQPPRAAVLHEINWAETKGSGIRTMRRLAADAGLHKEHRAGAGQFHQRRQHSADLELLLLYRIMEIRELLHYIQMPEQDLIRKTEIHLREFRKIMI